MRKDDQLTPMMRQYLDIKEKHQDMVLFFRLGDFYEMFNEDAVEVSRLLNLTLTKRGSAPMCGIPYHAARSYLKRLLDAGKKVAICEQLSLPDKPNELAKRSVTEIYTPATVVDDEYLDSLSSSYILAVTEDRKGLYLSWTDISTGEFYVRTLPLERDYASFESALSSISPKEILVPDDVYFTEKGFKRAVDSTGAMVTKLPKWEFTVRSGLKEATKQFPLSVLDAAGVDRTDPVLSAVGPLLKYLSDNTKAELPQLRVVEKITSESFLMLNAAAVKNLELVSSLSGSKEGSLLSAVNRTRTSSGSRLLRYEILHPLVDKDRIEKRLGWVERFVSGRDELERVRAILSQAADLERLAAKASMKKLTPRDLIAIADTTISFFTLVSEKSEYLAMADDFSESFDELLSFASDTERAISRDCTNAANAGTIVLAGYDSALDMERDLMEKGSAMLDEYIEKLKAETGIQTMRAGENRILGAFIEVSKGQLDKVPPYFIRRQTLVGGERFVTPELEDLKLRINTAAESAARMEKDIYASFVEKAFSLYIPIENMGRIISRLDYFTSLAALAVECGYARPEVVQEGEIEITDGRHPVVEHFTGRDDYVANSFSSSPSRFSLITGPNMAGKSTYLREIAVITLLAHIGSFVPARMVRIPITDKIFCRVGASDNLARGESTFLVEMAETAAILRSATPRSLVIMDEIGRGTSTEDGMSIAYAVMEYLKKVGCITLFATHYHELTLLDTSGLQLLHMAVREEKNTITFLRKAEPGVSASSYGIHVARLAGLPREVIKEASSFQRRHFADYAFDTAQGDLFIDSSCKDESDEEGIIREIEAFDTDSSTPLDALMFISELKKRLR